MQPWLLNRTIFCSLAIAGNCAVLDSSFALMGGASVENPHDPRRSIELSAEQRTWIARAGPIRSSRRDELRLEPARDGRSDFACAGPRGGRLRPQRRRVRSGDDRGGPARLLRYTGKSTARRSLCRTLAEI